MESHNIQTHFEVLKPASKNSWLLLMQPSFAMLVSWNHFKPCIPVSLSLIGKIPVLSPTAVAQRYLSSLATLDGGGAVSSHFRFHHVFSLTRLPLWPQRGLEEVDSSLSLWFDLILRSKENICAIFWSLAHICFTSLFSEFCASPPWNWKLLDANFPFCTFSNRMRWRNCPVTLRSVHVQSCTR